jgi:putative ABC transport system permease protein
MDILALPSLSKEAAMPLRRVISVAWKGLLKNKFRSLLTMLGVIIGVAAVIIMISVSAGTEATISERIGTLGSNLIFVQANFTRGEFGPNRQPGASSSSGGLVYSDATAIAQQVPGVDGVVVEQDSNQNLRTDSTTLQDVGLLGTTPDFPTVRDMTIANGRYFTQEEVNVKTPVAVLGSSLAQELFPNGEAVGQSIQAGNITTLTVVGVFAPKGTVGNENYDMQLYLPITVVFQRFTPTFFARVIGDRVRLIYVKVNSGVPLNQVINQITLLLAQRHNVSVSNPDFTITTQQDLISAQESTTAAFRNLLAWVAAVSLLVGGIGIMNIMMVSVTERTREIGIRQSVGASPNDIRMQFLTEALLLSLVGGLLGIFLGVGGSWVFSQLGGLRTLVLPYSVVLAFCSAAAVGIFFGYYPANQAAQLDPIEALRHE